jgi:hypothetical protein
MKDVRLFVLVLAGLSSGCGCGGAGIGDGDGDGDGEDGEGGEGDDDGALSCDEQLPARRVRRLSHAEYDRTIADLVGTDLGLSAAFAPDNVVDGYTNDAGAAVVSGLLADQYRVAAEAIADDLVADLGAVLPCDPTSDGESECAEAFVLDFGRRAFRRPLADEELARFLDLYAEVAAEDGFDEGVRWTIAAMLQAPGFVYRTELGEPQDDGTWRLTAHEIAMELSYLVVGGPPDAELSAAADEGALLDREVLQSHAERLLADARSGGPMEAFVEAWLRTAQLELVTRDEEKFPEFTLDIRVAMRGETRRLVAETWSSGGTLADLLLADHTFVTDALAAFYGIAPGDGEPDADGFRRADVGEHYGGVLTHGSVLATHALPLSSSPIHRGLLVRERLLCNDLPPPPPGVVNAPPEIRPGQSTRERYAMHTADPACAGCHALIDPIGWGFEHYDAIGRWRADDDGVAVDASGEITGATAEPIVFDGASELAAGLAVAPEIRACYAHQWSTYVLGGVVEDPGLACMAEAVDAGLADAEGRLDAAVLALVATPGFTTRRDDDAVPPMPTDDDGDAGESDDGGEASTAAADESSSGGAPPTDPDLEITIVQTGSWAEGECNEVTVTNVSDAAVDWQVTFTLMGTITTVWNAVATPDGADTIFSGAEHNATIAAAASAGFGYCLMY